MEGIEWARRAAKAGILSEDPGVDFQAIMRRKAEVVEQVVTNLEKHVLGAGVTVCHGSAVIKEPGEVRVDSGEVLRSRTRDCCVRIQIVGPAYPGCGSSRGCDHQANTPGGKKPLKS